jgi:hypothetical protein
MARAYWVVCYRSISNPVAARRVYQACRACRPRWRWTLPSPRHPAKTYEAGIDQRTVLVEFDSLAQAIATHDGPGYQAALAVLGNAAERDMRIVEGIDD